MPVPRSADDGASIDLAGRAVLEMVLERSRGLGFLGPGPVAVHLANASAFLGAVGDRRGRVLDLGSGGGVPGLVIGVARPDLELVLLDASQRRTTFLRRAVVELAITDRIEVVRGRAEDIARDPAHRGRYDVVTARSFGPPAVTLECGLGFLRGPGGSLFVSEPPDADPDRWPAPALREMAVVPGPLVRRGGGSVRRLDVVGDVPDRIPRRVGVPARRPLF